MLMIDDLIKITELINEEQRKEVNELAVSEFSEAEQQQIVDIFRDVLYDEIMYAMELIKFEREKEKYIRQLKKDKTIDIRSGEEIKDTRSDGDV